MASGDSLTREIYKRYADEAHKNKAIGLPNPDDTDAERSPKTIYGETTIVRQLVNFTLSRRLIVNDPLEGLKNRKPQQTKQPCWSPEEVEQILVAAKEPQKSMFLLLADTGMRFGEAQWLT